MNISEKRQGYINFKTLTSKIGESNAFKSNLKYFNNTTPLQSKGVEFVNAYIYTTIIYLKESEFSDYFTLRIINNNPQDKPNAFYNLVFEQNKTTGEVTSTIVQFLPALEWLFDKSQPFKGTILTYDNQLFSIDDLEGGLNGELPKVNPCTISAEWVCTVNNHPPGTPNCEGEWVITLGLGCSGSDGGGGGGDGGFGDGGSHGSGGGGGGSSSGSTQTVVIEICDGYSHDGGPANSEDCEDDYAAYFTPFICEDYVDFELINSINNWASNPSNYNAATDLANYLTNNFPQDEDDNCAELDLEHIVIIDREFKDNNCLNDVYEDMGKAPTFNNYLKNFEGTMSVANLRFSSSTDLPSNINATTSAPQNYMITITFNENNLNRPPLSVARTLIHEMIHAEIFRKLLSVWQHPSLDGITISDLILIKDDYPGIYDYYVRWFNNIPPGINVTTAQHQAMAQHYRHIISQAISEYDNNQHPQDIYDALAWQGLKVQLRGIIYLNCKKINSYRRYLILKTITLIVNKMEKRYLFCLLLFFIYFSIRSQNPGKLCICFPTGSEQIKMDIKNKDSTHVHFKIIREGFETEESRERAMEEYRKDLFNPLPNFYMTYIAIAKPVEINAIDEINCRDTVNINKYRKNTYKKSSETHSNQFIFLEKLEEGKYLKWEVMLEAIE